MNYRIVQRVPTLLIILSGIIISLLNFLFYTPFKNLEHDTAAWVLAGIGPILNIGVAYHDFWDRMPPGLGMAVFFWSKLFGYQETSFLFFHLITLLILTPLIYLVFRKIDKPILILPALISCYIITFSPYLGQYILTSEQLGLVFALFGLTLLLYFREHRSGLFLASLSLFLAGQMKDPFTPTLITVLPILLSTWLTKSKNTGKNLLSVLAGIGFGIIFITTYLYLQGNLHDYLEILKYKSSVFNVFNLDHLLFFLYSNIPQIIIRFYNFLTPVLLLPFLSVGLYFLIKLLDKNIVIRRTSKTISLKNDLAGKIEFRYFIDQCLVIVFAFSNYFGFSLQGDLSSHRLIQISVPTTIFIVYFLLVLRFSLLYFWKRTFKNSGLGIFNTAMFGVFIIFTLPKIIIINSYNLNDLPNKIINFKLSTPKDNSLYEFIQSNTLSGDCILDYYGWGVDKTYLYALRKPCTKFIKPALITAYPKYLKQLTDELKENPPKLFIYNRNGADMDIELFEKTTVNLKEVINNCYRKSRIENVYLPNNQNTIPFTKCYRSYFK